MSYKELIHTLHNTEPQPNPHYWQIVLNNADIILAQIASQNQGVVARDLNMDRMRLSHIKPILAEIVANNLRVVKINESTSPAGE